MRPVAGDRIAAALALLVFAMFAWLVLDHALTDSLCCGDDAAISMVAKSLARGEGYALPLNFLGESGRFLMHPGISSGPTVVLPAALLVWATGAQPWAPSLANALLSLGLFGVLAWRLRREPAMAPASASWFVLAALPALFFIFTGEFFVQWYALLGEVPAMLLLVVAAWVMARCVETSMDERGVLRRAFGAGLLVGLAINAKLLALLGGLALGGYYAWQFLRREPAALRAGIAYGIGAALPPLLLELVRLLTLGAGGYYRWLVEMRAFMGQQGSGDSLGLAARALAHLDGLQAAMGMGIAALALPLLVVLALKWRAPGAPRPALAALLALAASAVNLAWWLLLSNGWPRYALIGLGLLAISFGFAVAALPRRRALALLLLALACLMPWQRMDRVRQPLEYVARTGWAENPRAAALRRVARFIDRPEWRHSVVAGYWWASLAALEYSSAGSRRTVGFNRMASADPARSDTLLLDNPQWDAMANANADADYASLRRRCAELLLSEPPFSLYRCRLQEPDAGENHHP
jgi:hypothetical protein